MTRWIVYFINIWDSQNPLVQHANAWHRLGRPLVLVSQPTRPLSSADQLSLAALNEDPILRVRILESSPLELDCPSVEVWRLDGGGLRAAYVRRFPPGPIDVSDIPV